jgi:uncharacterized GH25 family protein
MMMNHDRSRAQNWPTAFHVHFIVLATLALASASLAHVFWLQPVTFHVKAGEIVRLQTRVADDFPGEVLPRNDQRITRFVVAKPDGTEPAAVVGMNGQDPMGMFKADAPGVYVVGFQSTHARVTLEPDKFHSYLKEEGLEKIIEKRKADGTDASPGREKYMRCAKTLIHATSTSAGKDASGEVAAEPSARSMSDRALGIRFELVLQGRIDELKIGDKVTIRALYEGEPILGVLVRAQNPNSQEAEGLAVTTDDQGEAEFVLPIAGLWRLNAVEMRPAKDDSEADWESVWASLTFKIPGT